MFGANNDLFQAYRRRAHACGMVGGKFVNAGGWGNLGQTGYDIHLDTAEALDLETGLWSPVGELILIVTTCCYEGKLIRKN